MEQGNKRSRQESTKESLRKQRINEALGKCDFCPKKGLLSWFATYGTHGCAHTVCASCLARHHAERGCNVFICRVCEKAGKYKRRIESTAFIEIDDRGIQRSEDEILIERPDRDRDPVRYFHHEYNSEKRHNSLLIATTYPLYNDYKKQFDYRRITMLLPTTIDAIVPEQEIVKLKELFLLLHPTLMKPPTVHYRSFLHPTDCPRPSAIAQPLELFKAAKNDQSVLYECILRMVTGDSTLKAQANIDEGFSGYSFSRLMAIWIAVEMIRRANSGEPSLFQRVLAEQLRLHQTPKRLMELLSKVRISASINYVDSHRINDIDKKILEGWNFKKSAFGLFVVLYDNFGFRIRGASAGYFQTTMVQVKYITPEELRTKVKAYGPDKLSRKKKKWEDVIRNDEVTPDIFLPDDKTDEALSARSLEWIELALKYADCVPTVEEARRVIDDYRSSAKAAFPLSHIPAEIRLLHNEFETSSDLDNPSNRLTTGVVLETEIPQDELDPEDSIGIGVEERQTMYEINNVKVELPWTKDLAYSKTTDDIRDYTIHLKDRAIAERDVDTSDDDSAFSIATSNNNDDASSISNDVEVMKDVGVFAVCDGAPAYQQNRSRDMNPEKYTHFKNYNGPFHEILEEMKKSGEWKDEIFAADLYSGWRKSRKAIEYVLFPSDPGQALPELIESTFGLLVSAIRKVVGILGRNTISPVNVLDHILERAREEPICMAVLCDMRFTDIIFMVRDSERANAKGDPELYRTALRYTAMLYSVTNAYRYVRILSENFKDWYCASDLEKAIYDEFLFTQKTRNGRPIWTDRSVEWMMKDLRSWLGKHYKPGLDILLSRLALNLSDMVKARTADTTGRMKEPAIKGPSAPKELGATRVFLSTLIWADEINLWGPGKIIYSKTGKKSQGYDGTAYDSTGKHKINLQHLLGFSIGKENYRKYVQEYLFDNLNQVSRTSDKAPLKKIPALKQWVDQQREIDLAFYESRRLDELNAFGVYRKEDIVEQAKKENDLLPNKIKLPAQSKRKQEQIEALLAIRKAADEGGIDLSRARPTDEEEESATVGGVGMSWKDQIKKETELPYFKLTKSQRDKFKKEEHIYTISRGVTIEGHALRPFQHSQGSEGSFSVEGFCFMNSQSP